MNPRFFLSAIFFLSVVSLHSQHQWARQSVGQGVDAHDMVIDPWGNSYVLGDFTGTVMWGNHSVTQDNTVNTQGPVFLAKYDAEGNAVWARGIKGKSSNNGNAVATDAVGNVYVCGEYDQTNSFSILDFGNGLTLEGNPSSSVFLAKADSSGTFRWAERILASDDVGEQRITAKDILVVGADVYITGEVLQPVSVGSTIYNTTNGDKTQMFIAKYDTAGNFQWFKHTNRVGDFGTASGAYLYAGKHNNIYVVGSHNKFSVTWDSQAFGVSPQLTNTHLFIGSFSSEGALLWHQWAATASTGPQKPHPVGVDADGNITTTIRALGSTQLSDTSFIASVDRYLVKFDSTGNRIYTKPMYGYVNLTTPGIQVHALYSRGNGTTFAVGTHTLNPIVFGQDTLPADPGGINLWNYFAAFDANGNAIDAKLWADEYLEPLNEFEMVMFTGDAQGNLFVTGKMEGAAKVGNDTLDQMFNMFLVKTDPNGFFELNTRIYDNLKSGRSFQVFPNPSSESVWLEYEPEKPENIEIQIENIQGQTVMRAERQFSPGVTRQQLLLAEIPAGVYAIRFGQAHSLIGIGKIVIRR
ncbi:MAG: T9SS type A sorting domain-containing protein [Bacteroidia bacterium]|nr:T9SS type A sorting domain-containing protein [Bacteroidia bacterium]